MSKTKKILKYSLGFFLVLTAPIWGLLYVLKIILTDVWEEVDYALNCWFPDDEEGYKKGGENDLETKI